MAPLTLESKVSPARHDFQILRETINTILESARSTTSLRGTADSMAGYAVVPKSCRIDPAVC